MEQSGRSGRYRELRSHWPLLLPCVAGIVLSSVTGYSLGVFIPALEREFGWSRADIALGPFIVACMALLGGSLAGAAIDRFGPRRVAIVMVGVYCLLVANLGTAGPDVAGWWLRWALLGLAAGFVMPTIWTKAIASTFSVNRGIALAIALCGTGIGAAAFPIVTQLLTAAYGWRGAYFGLAMLCALLVLPLVVLLFRSPADAPAVRPASGHGKAPVQGLSAREGFRSPAFLKLALAVLLFGVTSIALTATAVPILMSKGLDLALAARLAALIGVGSIIGRLTGGVLLDYVDARYIAVASVLIPILFALLLLAGPATPFAIGLACLLLGLSSGTEVDACAYLASQHLGMRSFGTLFGAINGMVFFGAGIAPFIANRVYDLTKSYDTVMWGMMPLCALSAMLFLWLGRAPQASGKEPAPGAAG